MNSPHTQPPNPEGTGTSTGTIPALGPVPSNEAPSQPGLVSTGSPDTSLSSILTPATGSMPTLGPILDTATSIQPDSVLTGSPGLPSVTLTPVTDTLTSEHPSLPGLNPILPPTQVLDNHSVPAPSDPTSVLSVISNSDPTRATGNIVTTNQSPATPNAPNTIQNTATTTRAQDNQNVQAGTLSAAPLQTSPSISEPSSTPAARHTAASAGGIVGGILGAGVLTFLLYFLIRHRRKKSGNASRGSLSAEKVSRPRSQGSTIQGRDMA